MVGSERVTGPVLPLETAGGGLGKTRRQGQDLVAERVNHGVLATMDTVIYFHQTLGTLMRWHSKWLESGDWRVETGEWIQPLHSSQSVTHLAQWTLHILFSFITLATARGLFKPTVPKLTMICCSHIPTYVTYVEFRQDLNTPHRIFSWYKFWHGVGNYHFIIQMSYYIICLSQNE